MRHAREDYNRIQDPDGKIPPEEPVFLLRGQDKLAANIVRAYAEAANAVGLQDIAKISMEWADTMDEWRKTNGGGKLPDLHQAVNTEWLSINSQSSRNAK